MNKLIQDISDKAWNYAYDHDTVKGEVVIGDGINMNFADLFIEKFTDLIVRECMKVSRKADELDAKYEAWYLIKEHFGADDERTNP